VKRKVGVLAVALNATSNGPAASINIQITFRIATVPLVETLKLKLGKAWLSQIGRQRAGLAKLTILLLIVSHLT
jgi:hypothetical protein